MFVFLIRFFDGDTLRIVTRAPNEMMERLMRCYQGLYVEIVVSETA